MTRVGSETSIPVDVRVIAATNRELEAAVTDGDFRNDLYYRLAVVPLRLPPLRERGDDVLLLAESFLRKFAGREMKIDADTALTLRSYRWPGNVRELENAMEQVVVLGSRGDVVHLSDLPARIREPVPATPPTDAEFPAAGVTLEEVEAHWIRAALRHTNGNRTHAARVLNITRQALLYRMDKHGIVFPRAEHAGDDDTTETTS